MKSFFMIILWDTSVVIEVGERNVTIYDNLKKVRAVIKEACEKSNRDEKEITIVAVTKYVDTLKTLEVIEAGIDHVGENRVEEGVKKVEEIGDKVTWHYIGNLQSRKVKRMIDKFDYIHSLDRMSLAKEIQKRAPEGKKIKCFVQVNVSGEETKSGVKPEETIDFIKQLVEYDAIEVVGLMTMAPLVDDPETVRPYFRKLREIKEEVESLKLDHAPCHHLSMGMSNDYRVAIEEGATFIRIGSVLVQ